MKSIVTLFLTIIVFTTSFAQQGINYKAVIKDDLGNVIADDLVQVQFSIRTGTTSADDVYVESQTTTTNSNGLIILNIGDGAVISGDFAMINWDSTDHYLNVQVNPGGGYVDMGTTQFMAVPYAKHALNASQATLADASIDNKWNVGGTNNDIVNNNTGKVVISNDLEIGGTLNIQTTATIDEFSTDGTLADNSNTALPTEQAVKAYVDANLSTGLEAIDEGNGIGWRLKGRDVNSYANIGLNAVDLSLSNNPGAELGATGGASFATGLRTLASGQSATAMGSNTIASGARSTAIGYFSESSGVNSISSGVNSIASGFNSMAMGTLTTASAPYSIAFGRNTIASGYSSVAMGGFTTAPSFRETALGSYNSIYNPTSTTGFYYTDRLFVVGNGQNQNNRSNALTIFKDGRVSLGNIIPGELLDVNGRVRIRRGGDATGGIWYTDSTGANNIFAGAKAHSTTNNAVREWGAYIQGWKFWVNGNGDATLTGSLTQDSDKRLKRNITDLKYGLNDVLLLQPKQYFWKNREDQEQASFGLIAQDVLNKIPNVVHERTGEEQTLSLSYIELIPVLINAIKEQQEIIENQKQKNKQQSAEIEQLQSLNNRLEQLEALLDVKK